MPDNPINNILVIRLSAIGDIVMASAIIAPLKLKYPDAKIYWLAQPESRSLLEYHPDITAVIPWPRSDWMALWKAKNYLELWRVFREFRQHLRSYNFDLALDLQGLLKSGLLSYASGAKKRIGLGSREGSQYLMHQVIPRDQGNTRLIGSEYRYLAEQLGLNAQPWQMRVAYDNATGKKAEQVVKGHVGSDNYIVICPFTTRPQKHWFNDYWVALVEKLKEEYQLPVVMLGGPADCQAAKAISDHTDVIDLTGKTALTVAAALIGRSKLLIGVDTGLTHMGHAAMVPTIALFGSTRPYLETGIESSHVIYHPRDCSPCKRKPTCEGRFDCMREITPDEVITISKSLVGASQ